MIKEIITEKTKNFLKKHKKQIPNLYINFPSYDVKTAVQTGTEKIKISDIISDTLLLSETGRKVFVKINTETFSCFCLYRELIRAIEQSLDQIV